MIEERTFKKYTFSILILLSICSIWIIYNSSDLSITKKSIFMCINMTYLFLIAEYIDTIVYHKILINVFNYKNISSSMYSLIYIILPIISLLIYVFAWVLYLSDSFFDIQTTSTLIFLSESCIIYSFFGKKNIVFSNKDNIIMNFRLITYNEINNYHLSKKEKMDINVVKVHLNHGDEISFSVDSKRLDELIENLSK